MSELYSGDDDNVYRSHISHSSQFNSTKVSQIQNKMNYPPTSFSSFVEQKTLIFHTLDPRVSCGDGSPAGFYADAVRNGSNNFDGRTNHIINFMGGGACANKDSCDSINKQQPWMLSSKFETEIEGHTILSDSPIENPAMSSFVKWNIPYCSQDLWLGCGDSTSGFNRSGSVHARAFLTHWLNTVQESQASVDTLVVSGVSAGAIAVLNHFGVIQSIAKQARVKSLRLIMDASLYTDRIDTDFRSLFDQIVDIKEHPMCFRRSPIDELSKLPCCLSTHCMLRHTNALSDWARSGSPTGNAKRLLLIDSVYDTLQMFLDLSATSAPLRAGEDPKGLSALSDNVFNIGEFGGSRKMRVLETLYGGEEPIGSSVVWAMSSAPSHNVLIPSVELTSRLCQSGNQLLKESSKCEPEDCVFSKYPGGVYQVCNSTGSGLKTHIMNGLFLSSWTTTESWKRVSVDGQSIQEIITNFIRPASSFHPLFAEGSPLMIDSCSGPNCVPKDQAGSNIAQSLIELDDSFISVPTWLSIFVTLFMAAIPILYFLMARKKRPSASTSNLISNDQTARNNCQEGSIFLEGLDVHAKGGDQILDKVSIRLEPASLNCLLGKSGSGKSTLLSVLSLQLRSNLIVNLKGGSDLGNVKSTYMRQDNLVTMENVTAKDYLHLTSLIFGANPDKLEFVLDLVKPFFPVRTKADEENDTTIATLDPFNNTSIKELSGGQRRMIAIAAALFQKTSLLILDEPLSGLDSASSQNVIDLLKFIASQNGMTVLMTLHQPSNYLLHAMDKVMVLEKGSVIYDSCPPLDEKAAEFIHDLIFGKHSHQLNSQTLQSNQLCLQNTVRSYPESEIDLAETISPETEYIQPTNTTSPHLSLWQVQPLVRRLHLECPPNVHDVFVLPVCFLAISLWGRLDPKNPLQTYLITASFTIIPSVLFQTKMIMNWHMLNAHLWDLEDKRICCLSYQLSSGLHMLYVPVLSVFGTLAVAYASLGWSWDSYWAMSLFCVMLTVSFLQLGKTLSAGLGIYQNVAAGYSIYLYLSFVFSGFFVNPAQVPTNLRWIMYLSMVFWGISGSELSMLEHNDLGEQPCTSFVSCIVYNRNFVGHSSGFSLVTTAYKSMLALIVAFILMICVEHYLLRKKVLQRRNYKVRAEEKPNPKT